MSEIPALRDALVDAAARRARRRRRIAFRLVAWSAAATAAAAAIVLAVTAPRDREVPAATPTPPGQLERGFAAFRRPATAADALPADVTGYRDVDSRLVRDADGSRIWLFAATQSGRPARLFCAAVRGAGGDGSVCTGGGPVPLVSQIGRRDGPDGVLFVLPDGSGDPQVLTRGSVVEPEVHDNVALAGQPESIVSASYTDTSGVRRISRWRDLHANGWTPQGCPALDPLPADAEAQARRATLLAVSRVYPWIQEASVTGVSPAGPGLCTREVTDRSLAVSLRILPFDASQRKSASLTQGRLLVGMQGGRMSVWRVQH
jgi:hypothetical protein